MSSTQDVAVFLDFDNLALGLPEQGFDIDRIMDRLLDRGRVLVRRAYADWTRWRSARKALHSAGFELIDTPPSTWGGKNGADIRIVVDALDLAFSRPHLGGFVVISGDSDFCPLVTKLREYGKEVTGLGVRGAVSKLLVQSCDDFLFYDDLRTEAGPAVDNLDRPTALKLLAATSHDLLADRSEDYVWGSHVKQVVRRKRPHFAERQLGYKSFSQMLEDARDQGLLSLKRDDRSGGYQIVDA